MRRERIRTCASRVSPFSRIHRARGGPAIYSVTHSRATSTHPLVGHHASARPGSSHPQIQRWLTPDGKVGASDGRASTSTSRSRKTAQGALQVTPTNRCRSMSPDTSVSLSSFLRARGPSSKPSSHEWTLSNSRSLTPPIPCGCHRTCPRLSPGRVLAATSVTPSANSFSAPGPAVAGSIGANIEGCSLAASMSSSTGIRDARMRRRSALARAVTHHCHCRPSPNTSRPPLAKSLDSAARLPSVTVTTSPMPLRPSP